MTMTSIFNASAEVDIVDLMKSAGRAQRASDLSQGFPALLKAIYFCSLQSRIAEREGVAFFNCHCTTYKRDGLREAETIYEIEAIHGLKTAFVFRLREDGVTAFIGYSEMDLIVRPDERSIQVNPYQKIPYPGSRLLEPSNFKESFDDWMAENGMTERERDIVTAKIKEFEEKLSDDHDGDGSGSAPATATVLDESETAPAKRTVVRDRGTEQRR